MRKYSKKERIFKNVNRGNKQIYVRNTKGTKSDFKLKVSISINILILSLIKYMTFPSTVPVALFKGACTKSIVADTKA
jgi:hypothetical protein